MTPSGAKVSTPATGGGSAEVASDEITAEGSMTLLLKINHLAVLKRDLEVCVYVDNLGPSLEDPLW